MNLLKIIIVFFILVVFSNKLHSQEIEIESGKTISSFKYTDSQNNSLDNLQAASSNFMSLGYRTTIYKNLVFGSLGINYIGYNAKGSDDTLFNYMEWNTTFLGIYGSVDVKVACYKKFQLHLKGSFSPEFLIQGSQTLNNRVYNLVGSNDFDNSIYFLKGGAFINYPISDFTKLTIQYVKGQTLNSEINKEKLNIIAQQLSFGFQINLKPSEK